MAAAAASIMSRQQLVLCVDECHLHWGDALGYVWGPQGKRVSLPMTNGQERQTYYGALDVLTGRAFTWSALGATTTQTVFRVVLPVAMPGILTGTILAVSRALGETAPLITIGALTYVAFLPTGPMSEFTVLPIQIFNWVSRPQAAFQDIAAAGIIVLLSIMLLLNGAAIYLRNKYRKPVE